MNLVFFDLDGTLEDSRLDMSLSVNRVRASFNLPAHDIDWLKTKVNGGMDFLYRACFAELYNECSVEEKSTDIIRKVYESDYFDHVADNTKAYDGITESLRRIRNCSFVLYTNKPERISRELLRRLDLISLFSGIIGGDSFPVSKPSPEPMKKIAADLQFSPGSHRCGYIGDTEADMKAARAFGASSIWCSWGYQKEIPETTPDFIAGGPEELPEIIESLFQE